MTDITELAQALKAAAEKWQEAWGKYDKVEITIAEFIRAANQYESIVKDPANILALVEALEKAQQRISELEAYSKTALKFREAARDENRHLKLSLKAVEDRVIELESRTVTVKLPRPGFVTISGERTAVYLKADVDAAMLAAGIEESR